MTENTEVEASYLTSARDALRSGDWNLASEILTEADAEGALGADELMLLSEAAYGAGHLEAALAACERAHADAVRADDRIAAAAAATRLSLHLLIDTGLLAPVRGWAKRAERLLEGIDDTPVHAWIFVVRACERWLSGDFEASSISAARAIAFGDRHNEPGAATFGRVAAARCHIFEGRLDEGLRILDEAESCLLSGEIDALTAGMLYCELVCVWQGLGLYDRAEEWTAAMERFGHDNAIGSVDGRCRIHRAEILRLRGALPEAEQEALHACDALRPYLRYEYGWPLTELGRIRLVRGDLEGAEQALLAAHQLGWDPQPDLARLRLAQGDVTAATESIRAAIDRPLNVPSKERPPNNDLRKARLLEAQVEIGVAAGDVEVARCAAEELERIAVTFRSKSLAASAALATGRVRLAEGDVSAARRHLQNAVQRWSELAAPYETATARIVLARAHRAEGNESNATLELRAARSAFEGLGASYDVDRVSNELDAVAPQTSPSEPLAKSEFRREGDYWSITFDGATVRLRDMVGLQYLCRLLRDAGREFHVLDLVASGRGETASDHVDPELIADADLGAGAPLDRQAKELYRRRLEDIEEDIEEAKSFSDSERVARAIAEREFLVRELSAAVGLGGRDRRAGATSERARAAVTRAIRHAMMRIRAEHPMLGEHLERTIRTGTFCSYMPDPRAPVHWAL